MASSACPASYSSVASTVSKDTITSDGAFSCGTPAATSLSSAFACRKIFRARGRLPTTLSEVWTSCSVPAKTHAAIRSSSCMRTVRSACTSCSFERLSFFSCKIRACLESSLTFFRSPFRQVSKSFVAFVMPILAQLSCRCTPGRPRTPLPAPPFFDFCGRAFLLFRFWLGELSVPPQSLSSSSLLQCASLALLWLSATPLAEAPWRLGLGVSLRNPRGSSKESWPRAWTASQNSLL